MFDKNITKLFIVTAATYLISLAFSQYPLQFAVKSLPIFILCLTCFSTLTGRDKLFMSSALLFSLTGDILLAINFPLSFELGLLSFLIAHCFYGIYFISLNKSPAPEKTLWAKIVAIAIFSIIAASVIIPSTYELVIPVSIYLVVITFMAITALYKQLNSTVILGVCCFLLSDTLLALNMFVSPLPMASVLVMVTYYMAQYFITRGVFLQIKTQQ